MYKIAILSKIKLPFYNIPIERPIKSLKNIDPLVELPFYEQLSITKTDKAFKGYAMSYKVDLLNELKGFKYQITIEVLLKKYKLNKEIEFRPVYFNSVTKTVTNHMFRLEKSFEEILYMIDVWINSGSG